MKVFIVDTFFNKPLNPVSITMVLLPIFDRKVVYQGDDITVHKSHTRYTTKNQRQTF